MHSPVKSLQGFILDKLLIALSILGVMAIFTMPKIIASQQNARYTAQ